MFTVGDSEINYTDTITQLKALKQAIADFSIGPDVLKIFENANKRMISMNDQTLLLQRSMGGVAISTDYFRERIYNAYTSTINIGSTFKEVTEAVQGLSDGMGRIVNPSKEVLENIVQLSKGTGSSVKEISTLITQMTRFGGTQEEATENIHNLSVEARKAGLSAGDYLKEISANMKNVSGFGFKSGVDGMKNMVKQAMLLRTTVDKIGAKNFADTLLDPEEAINAAASMQMLGGAVGKLADPFQLMYMAQNDMQGLQKELLNSTKAAFTFNKATGGFEASTEDLYRLRQQAKITGQNFDELLESGKEASKMDYLKEKFDLGSMSEDTQSLVAGLAEIGKDGKVSIDIPGFKKIEADSAEQLKVQLQNTDTQKALQDYQNKANLSEKDLASAQLTVSETQSIDINIIKEALLKNMTDTERNDFLKEISETNKNIGEKLGNVADIGSMATKEGVIGTNKVVSVGADKIATELSDRVRIEEMKDNFEKLKEKLKKGEGIPVSDGFFPSSGPTIIRGKGEMYKTLPDDQIAVGTNLSNYLNQVGGGSNNLDINVKITGTVGGDSANNINKMFEDPRVKKQIMDTVLYNLNSYKKQQGVIA